MNEPVYTVILLVVIAVYIWTCYTIGEKRHDRRTSHDMTYIFGRVYYSQSTMKWLYRGVGHARKMTGRELAQYDTNKTVNRQDA